MDGADPPHTAIEAVEQDQQEETEQAPLHELHSALQALEARLQSRASLHVTSVTPFFQEQQLLTAEDLQLSPGRLNSRPTPGTTGSSSAGVGSEAAGNRADGSHPEQSSSLPNATATAEGGGVTSQQQQQEGEEQQQQQQQQQQQGTLAARRTSREASTTCADAVQKAEDVPASSAAPMLAQELEQDPACTNSSSSSKPVADAAGAGEGAAGRVRWDASTQSATGAAPEQQQQQQQQQVMQQAVDMRVRSPSPNVLLQPSSHSVYAEVSWSDPGSHYSFHGQLQEASSYWAAGTLDQEGSMLADGDVAPVDVVDGLIAASGSLLGGMGQGVSHNPPASGQAGSAGMCASPQRTAAAAGRHRTAAKPSTVSTAAWRSSRAMTSATGGRGSWARQSAAATPAQVPVMAAFSGMLFRPAVSNLPAPHYVPPMTLDSILATGKTAAAAGRASAGDYDDGCSSSGLPATTGTTAAVASEGLGVLGDSSQPGLTAEMQQLEQGQLEQQQQQQQEDDDACNTGGLLPERGHSSVRDRSNTRASDSSSSSGTPQQQRTVRPLMETYMAQRSTLTATGSSYSKQGTLLAKGLTAAAASASAAAPAGQEGIADAVPTCRSPVSPDRTLTSAAAAAARGSVGQPHMLQSRVAASADVQRPLDALQHAEKLLQRRPDPSSPSKQRQLIPSSKGAPTTTVGGPRARARQWAEDDAAADAEADAWLADHRRQQQLPHAALLLQTAWRARAPRLLFNRWHALRTKTVARSVSASFRGWCAWVRASRHRRHSLVAAAWRGWRELMQLELLYCSKVLLKLQRGALVKGSPAARTWMLCTDDLRKQYTTVPSIGGSLATVLQQLQPKRQLQGAFTAWRKHTAQQAQRRAAAGQKLAEAAGRWQLQAVKQALRFWMQMSMALMAERLELSAPLFEPRLAAYDSWLWEHERKQHLKAKTNTMYRLACMRRCYRLWQRHTHKVSCMRAAFKGMVLHTRPQLLRTGLWAFVLNLREAQRQRQRLGGCLDYWRNLTRRNLEVRSVQKKIRLAVEHRLKVHALQAFRRFTRASQLLNAAAQLRLAHARPLALAHVCAWRGDRLHMVVLLCWVRWRRMALGRLRLRAFLGQHMFRQPQQQLQLALNAWRKVTAAIKEQRLNPQPLPAERCHVVAAGSPSSVRSSGTQGPMSGSSMRRQVKHPWDLLPDDEEEHTPSKVPPQQQQQAAGSRPQSGGDAEDGEEECHPLVHASLADYPRRPPWRHLVTTGDTLAPLGLLAPNEIQLAKQARDLRDLQGRFMVSDREQQPLGLATAALFAREAPPPGLLALARAQVPMTKLWLLHSPADAALWQRLVGLVATHQPHPDSWTGVLLGSPSRLQLLAASSIPPPPTAHKLYPAYHEEFEAQREMAAAMQEAGLLPADVASEYARTPAASWGGASHDSRSQGGASYGGAALQPSPSFQAAAEAAGVEQEAFELDAFHRQLSVGEELLEAAVHALLGIGRDSTDMLYMRTQLLMGAAWDRHQLQGDVLLWLLEPALLADSQQARFVRASTEHRDRRLLDTWELHEKALALHIHQPIRFTIDFKGAVRDMRKVWADAEETVEEERNWDLSSDEEEEELRRQQQLPPPSLAEQVLSPRPGRPGSPRGRPGAYLPLTSIRSRSGSVPTTPRAQAAAAAAAAAVAAQAAAAAALTASAAAAADRLYSHLHQLTQEATAAAQARSRMPFGLLPPAKAAPRSSLTGSATTAAAGAMQGGSGAAGGGQEAPNTREQQQRAMAATSRPSITLVTGMGNATSAAPAVPAAMSSSKTRQATKPEATRPAAAAAAAHSTGHKATQGADAAAGARAAKSPPGSRPPAAAVASGQPPSKALQPSRKAASTGAASAAAATAAAAAAAPGHGGVHTRQQQQRHEAMSVPTGHSAAERGLVQQKQQQQQQQQQTKQSLLPKLHPGRGTASCVPAPSLQAATARAAGAAGAAHMAPVPASAAAVAVQAPGSSKQTSSSSNKGMQAARASPLGSGVAAAAAVHTAAQKSAVAVAPGSKRSPEVPSVAGAVAGAVARAAQGPAAAGSGSARSVASSVRVAAATPTAAAAAAGAVGGVSSRSVAAGSSSVSVAASGRPGSSGISRPTSPLSPWPVAPDNSAVLPSLSSAGRVLVAPAVVADTPAESTTTAAAAAAAMAEPSWADAPAEAEADSYEEEVSTAADALAAVLRQDLPTAEDAGGAEAAAAAAELAAALAEWAASQQHQQQQQQQQQGLACMSDAADQEAEEEMQVDPAALDVLGGHVQVVPAATGLNSEQQDSWVSAGAGSSYLAEESTGSSGISIPAPGIPGALGAPYRPASHSSAAAAGAYEHQESIQQLAAGAAHLLPSQQQEQEQVAAMVAGDDQADWQQQQSQQASSRGASSQHTRHSSAKSTAAAAAGAAALLHRPSSSGTSSAGQQQQQQQQQQQRTYEVQSAAAAAGMELARQVWRQLCQSPTPPATGSTPAVSPRGSMYVTSATGVTSATSSAKTSLVSWTALGAAPSTDQPLRSTTLTADSNTYIQKALTMQRRSVTKLAPELHPEPSAADSVASSTAATARGTATVCWDEAAQQEEQAAAAAAQLEEDRLASRAWLDVGAATAADNPMRWHPGLEKLLQQLEGAPFATRYAFWQQVQQQMQQQQQQQQQQTGPSFLEPQQQLLPEASSAAAADQSQEQEQQQRAPHPTAQLWLHQLAWAGLLQRSPAGPVAPPASSSAAAASIPLSSSRSADDSVLAPEVPKPLYRKLRRYLSVYLAWRKGAEEQQGAEQPRQHMAWAALEQEEQVVNYMAKLTIQVYDHLLRRARGLPPKPQALAAQFVAALQVTKQQGASATASAAAHGGLGLSQLLSAAGAATSSSAATSSNAAGLVATGQQLASGHVGRVQPTLARRPPPRPVLEVFVPTSAAQLKGARAAAAQVGLLGVSTLLRASGGSWHLQQQYGGDMQAEGEEDHDGEGWLQGGGQQSLHEQWMSHHHHDQTVSPFTATAMRTAASNRAQHAQHTQQLHAHWSDREALCGWQDGEGVSSATAAYSSHTPRTAQAVAAAAAAAVSKHPGEADGNLHQMYSSSEHMEHVAGAGARADSRASHAHSEEGHQGSGGASRASSRQSRSRLSRKGSDGASSCSSWE